MPKKTKQTKAPPKAKVKEPKSKFTYDMSKSDLPLFTGTLCFDASNDERAEAVRKQFPSYDRGDPRTFVAIPYSTIRASLGSDYTGQEQFPPYVAYPEKVARSFSKYAASVMGIGNPGTLHRLYPLNFDQRGRLRENVGMTKTELAEFLFRFGDGTKKQPKQANKKTRARHLKAWLDMERDEEKRELEMDEAEMEMLVAEAEGEIARRQHTPCTDEAAEASDETGHEQDDTSAANSQQSNSKKRAAGVDVGDETDERCTKKAKVAPSPDED